MTAKCTYCRRTVVKPNKTYPSNPLMQTRDHVVPLSRGGADTADNRVPACQRCNHLKGDMLPYDWWLCMVNNPYWWLRTKFERQEARRLGQPLPMEHSQYILKHGKKAYRVWLATQNGVTPATS